MIFAESKNSIEAAKTAELSQPAVSIQLKRLEELLPQSPFSNFGQKKVLNQYGKQLYENIKQNIEALGNSIQEVGRSFAEPSQLFVKVSGREEILKRAFRTVTFPGRIEIDSCSSAEALNRLFSRKTDIAITHAQPDSSLILSKKLFSSQLELVMHKKYLPKNFNGNFSKTSNCNFLLEVPHLAYKPDDLFFRTFITSIGLEPKLIEPRYICSNWTILRSLVKEGYGFCIMPSEVSGSDENIYKFKLSSLFPKKTTFFALYYKDFSKLNGVREFIESLVKTLNPTN